MSELTHGSFDIRPESGGYDPPKDELVALRAKLEQCQIERDTISTDWVDERDELRAKLEQAERERGEAKQNYLRACETIYNMWVAATGRTDNGGPKLGVIEDMEAVRNELDAALARVKVLEDDNRTYINERHESMKRVEELEADNASWKKKCQDLCCQYGPMLIEMHDLKKALAALPLVEGGEFTVGSLDPDTDTYPVYMKVGCTQCGSIAEFYSQERAQGYINLLTLWQRMGR